MVTIYHNPKCSKSRETLALIRARGIEPEVVEYLKQPLGEQTLRTLLAQSGLKAEQILRNDSDAYQQYVAGKTLNEAELIALMAEHPSLLNRPLVISDKGARLCRPPELVNEIL